MYGAELLDFSYGLRTAIEAEDSDKLDRFSLMLLSLLDISIKDHEYQLGRIANPYQEENLRVQYLNEILMITNKILDLMQEQAVSMGCIDNLPTAASGLIQFLFAVSLNVSIILGRLGADRIEAERIKAQRPEYQEQALS